MVPKVFFFRFTLSCALQVDFHQSDLDVSGDTLQFTCFLLSIFCVLLNKQWFKRCRSVFDKLHQMTIKCLKLSCNGHISPPYIRTLTSRAQIFLRQFRSTIFFLYSLIATILNSIMFKYDQALRG